MCWYRAQYHNSCGWVCGQTNLYSMCEILPQQSKGSCEEFMAQVSLSQTRRLSRGLGKGEKVGGYWEATCHLPAILKSGRKCYSENHTSLPSASNPRSFPACFSGGGAMPATSEGGASAELPSKTRRDSRRCPRRVRVLNLSETWQASSLVLA